MKHEKPDRMVIWGAVWAAIFFPFLLIFGPSSCTDSRPDESVFHTPAGRYVKIRDRGSFKSGALKPLQVLAWLDVRIDEWIALRSKDRDPVTIRKIADQVYYLLIDDYRFEDSLSPSGFAAGATLPGSVAACIWSRATSPTKPDAIPLWLVRQNPATGLWSYGMLPAGGGLQVVGHELDHQIGIDHPLVMPPD